MPNRISNDSIEKDATEHNAYREEPGSNTESIMLQEIDIEVVRELCEPFPESHSFVQRLRHNPKALYLEHWREHFEWQFAASVFPKNAHVLDWGCGTGHSDFFLAANGYRITGVDIDPLGIQIAEYVRSLQSEQIQNAVSFHLETPALSYDAAWSSHVLEHVPKEQWHGFFVSVAATGAPSLLVSVPLGRAYFDPDHKNFWDSADELSRDLREHSECAVTWAVVNHEHEVIRAMLSLPEVPTDDP